MAIDHGHRAPHTLRIAILLLRLALGFNLFFLGWSELFDRPLAAAFRDRALGTLYAMASQAAVSPFGAMSIPAGVIAWFFLVVGACLFLGFLTEPAAILGIILILLNYLPAIGLGHFSFASLVSDDLVVFGALLVIAFGRAGSYLGLDGIRRFARRNS